MTGESGLKWPVHGHARGLHPSSLLFFQPSIFSSTLSISLLLCSRLPLLSLPLPFLSPFVFSLPPSTTLRTFLVQTLQSLFHTLTCMPNPPFSMTTAVCMPTSAERSCRCHALFSTCQESFFLIFSARLDDLIRIRIRDLSLSSVRAFLCHPLLSLFLRSFSPPSRDYFLFSFAFSFSSRVPVKCISEVNSCLR